MSTPVCDFGGRNGAEHTTVEWYTPRYIFDALGLYFDLDPCAPKGGVPWIPAFRSYSIEDDGLSKRLRSALRQGGSRMWAWDSDARRSRSTAQEGGVMSQSGGWFVHVIPVPVGWSIEQAWEAIRRNDVPFENPNGPPSWANIETDQTGRLIRVLPMEDR